MIASIVLAAGAGRRFGGRKQLAPLGGRPLVEHALAAASAQDGPTLLVLGADAAAIEAGIDLGDATVVHCPDWKLGPGASLRRGLTALDPAVDAAMIMLGDEPFLSPTAIDRVISARHQGAQALRATYHGRPGHPVLIERPLFATLIAAPANRKPMAVLVEAGVGAIECGDLGRPADVDTREHLVALERDLSMASKLSGISRPPRRRGCGPTPAAAG